MDIDQLRGWATFMDRVVVVSLVVNVLVVAALTTATWLSLRIGDAVRAHEHAAFLQYRLEMRKHDAELEKEVSRARERAQDLEHAVSDADARAVQAARESATANEKAHSAELDAVEVRKRVAELEKGAMAARARTPDPAQAVAPETPQQTPQRVEHAATERPAESREPPSASASPIGASLRKYAGIKAAVFVLDEARDASALAATVSGYLSDAGWVPMTWTWTGVGGILGVVVLVKDGSDPATNEAASALVDALRSAGFNATRADWPADWRRYRGTLNGPETPGPTEAPIRIVVGAKAR